jgi:hypothetical protein
MKSGRFLVVVAGCAALAGAAFGQFVISAKSGMVNYVEGTVTLDNKPVQMKFGDFPQVANASELRSTEGRAEVLLGPGVFLRMGENTGFKMISDRIADTQLQFLGGSMLVECAELSKDESVTIAYRDASVSLARRGLYRIDSAPAQLMVYRGEATVTIGGQTQVVKSGRLLPLAGIAVAEKFDNKTGDALFRWARRRTEYLAMANVSAAREIHTANSFSSNHWVWNPYFGAYTFVPMGVYNSYWGFRFWSPSQVSSMYVPPRQTWSSGTPSTSTGMQPTSAGTSGSVARASSSPSQGVNSPRVPPTQISPPSGHATSRSR